MTATRYPHRVGTLAECPRCWECCYAVMTRSDGSLYLRPHGAFAPPRRVCYGPTSDELIDLLITQSGLRVAGDAA